MAVNPAPLSPFTVGAAVPGYGYPGRGDSISGLAASAGAMGHLETCGTIMRRRPGWYVGWGSVTRTYQAFPGFDVPEGERMVSDPDPFALIARMDELKRRHG